MSEQPPEPRLLVEVNVDWALESSDRLVDARQVEILLGNALERERMTGSWLFAIRFVDDREMAQLHETWLGDPSPTDILTFAYEPDDEAHGGDIVISVETAGRNAVDAGWRLPDELDFLMLHGLLHVLGWDDRSVTGRSAMLERQYELLASSDVRDGNE
ncbi:MAG: rRNA maturation RNase YbeY [Chloroflexia bacterium]|nr:rRNA maturation RNase YbeY [Chloroflexia bacterium]